MPSIEIEIEIGAEIKIETETETPQSTVPPRPRPRPNRHDLRIYLHHTDLPILEDAGLIEYDAAARRVEIVS